MDYSALTDTLNNLVQEDEKDWINVPGGLDKVSESAMGAAWGLGSGKMYVCMLPCKGQWTPVVFPDPAFNIIDFTTDDSTIYVLGSGISPIGIINLFTTKNGNNSGKWSPPNPLFKAEKITELFNTGSYIWGQMGTQKYKLAKPGTTSNWIEVQDTSGVKITSASQTALYGISSTGVAMKTDESLQSAWSPIPQFKGVFTGILGDADQTGIYGIDAQKTLQKCSGDSCVPIPTKNPVQTLSPKPTSLWLTTSNPGDLGNVYYKDESPSNLLKDVQPIDAERDAIVNQAETEYTNTTYSTMMFKQLKEIQKMFGELLSIQEVNTEPIEKSASTTSSEASLLQKVIPFLLKGILVLLGVLFVYLFSGVFGSMTHYVAFAVLIGEIYLLLNNGV
jgi:hypothetical protein